MYFEAEKEGDLRKVGYSKERRVDPQVVVGLLVDRHGFPLEIGCFEGNKAECDTRRVIHRFGSLRVIYISGRRACMKDGLFLEMIGLPHANQEKQAIAMYHTTGFTSDELIDICVLITSVDREPDAANWPPCLGLLDSVVATLAYLRHNRTQVEIGESLGVSQPTISRAITVITPLLSAALAEHVATAGDLDPEAQYIVDGTLLPCWSWAGCKELYSGKHKTTGMNVQVACTIHGKPAWISGAVNGSRHDNYCLGESDVLRTLDPKNWIGDKGYIGNEMITPFKKPEGRELLDWQKEFNTEVNKIRWMIEQVISHFKNWTVMRTDYRRPLSTFATTISAVIGLHFYPDGVCQVNGSVALSVVADCADVAGCRLPNIGGSLRDERQGDDSRPIANLTPFNLIDVANMRALQPDGRRDAQPLCECAVDGQGKYQRDSRLRRPIRFRCAASGRRRSRTSDPYP